MQVIQWSTFSQRPNLWTSAQPKVLKFWELALRFIHNRFNLWISAFCFLNLYLQSFLCITNHVFKAPGTEQTVNKPLQTQGTNVLDRGRWGGWDGLGDWGDINTLLKKKKKKIRASPIAQVVKNLPAMQETWVWFLRRDYPLEKEMATHSSILAWRIPWTGEPGRLQSMGLQELDTDLATREREREREMPKIAGGNLRPIAQGAQHSALWEPSWVGREGQEGVQEGGDICTHIADALHCTIATNTTVKQVYSIKK